MRVLERILASKARDIEALCAVERRRWHRRSPLDVATALRSDRASGLRLIAEVKLRSPSAGPLSRALTPAERAAAYAESGAAMVSVLCDAPFFDGSWDHLSEARDRLEACGTNVPLLAKEFVLDPRQIQEARDRGADAILLIARIVDRSTLADFVRCAQSEGIEPFVEVVDERELEAALQSGARVVGVNARDLDTLEMDAVRTARVLAAIPAEIVAVHLSGIRRPGELRELAGGRADAALIGEALMREADPQPLLRALVSAARNFASRPPAP